MAELGEVLRTWRDRLQPADVGLPAGAGRRAAGLRREELALLAGLSVEYLVRRSRAAPAIRRRLCWHRWPARCA